MFDPAATILTYLGTFVFWLPVLLFFEYLLLRLQQDYDLGFAPHVHQALLSPSSNNDFYSQVKDLLFNPDYEPEAIV